MSWFHKKTCLFWDRFLYVFKKMGKKKAASISCLKAMKTIKQCSENRKLETIK